MFALTVPRSIPDSCRLEMPAFERGPRGYHESLAALVGKRFGGRVDQEALARVLSPCSDGTVPAVAHAVAARQADLKAHYYQWDDPRAAARLAENRGIGEEIESRLRMLTVQGQQLGVEFFDTTVGMTEIRERVHANQVGLVSLDWNEVLAEPRVSAALPPEAEARMLPTGDVPTPFFCPVVPVVGYDSEDILVQTHAGPISIPTVIFESARRSPLAEQAAVFVSDKELVRVDRSKKRLNPQEIREKFHVEERRGEDPEFWAEMVEFYCDGKEPVDTFLAKAEEYGLSHQTVEAVFDFVWTRCAAKAPNAYYRVAAAIQMAEMRDIKAAEFSEYLQALISAVDKKAEARPERYHPIGDFQDLLERVVKEVCTYSGPGRVSLGAALSYHLMDLKRLAGPAEAGSSRRPSLEPYKVREAPFVEPDLKDWRPERFKYIRPPRPGEPDYISKTRVLLEWLETNAAQSLRECLCHALGRGSVRIGNSEQDILTTPFHRLVEALHGKIGGATPYFVKELCLNHGLSAYRMLAEFDACVDQTGEFPEMVADTLDRERAFTAANQWRFIIAGLLQNLREVNAVPSSFTAEREYLSEVLPWLLAGKFHPGYARIINDMVRSGDTRYDDHDGQRMRAYIAEAKSYLSHLLTAESRIAHDEVWEAFDGVKDMEIREKLRPLLTTCFTARTLAEFKPAWITLTRNLHPDSAPDPEPVARLARVFLEYSLERKKELEDKEQENAEGAEAGVGQEQHDA